MLLFACPRSGKDVLPSKKNENIFEIK